jgi:predicted RecA/RadA family phage recombinase
MKTYVNSGNQIKYVLSGTKSAGDVVVVEAGLAVLASGGVSGETVMADVEGVFEIAKATGAIVAGDRLWWDAGNSNLTKTELANKFAGIAYEAAASGDATVKISLEPQVFAQAALVSFTAGSNLSGVDGAGSNAAPLAGTETRLDALDTAVSSILTSLKAAGLMLNA